MIRFGLLCVQAEREVGVLGIVTSQMAYVHMARNALVRMAQRYQPRPTHLIFIDQDSIPWPDTITKLVAADKPIICAVYYQKQPPYKPVIFHLHPEYKLYDYDFPDPEINPEPFLIKDGGVGMGATMIKMEVFDQMDKQFGDKMWFQTPTVVAQVNGKDEQTLMGEDLFFCDRANQMGIEIWCDPSDLVHHIGNVDVCGELFRTTRQMRQEYDASQKVAS